MTNPSGIDSPRHDPYNENLSERAFPLDTALPRRWFTKT